MTTIQTVVFAAATWAPRERPNRAVMPILVTVERRTSALVPDLCWELDRKLAWAVFGETAIPAGFVPAGRHHSIVGSARQGGGDYQCRSESELNRTYEQGSTEPSVSEVRLILTQPITKDLSDMELLIARRDDLLDVLGPLNGTITGASTGREFTTEFSEEFT